MSTPTIETCKRNIVEQAKQCAMWSRAIRLAEDNNDADMAASFGKVAARHSDTAFQWAERLRETGYVS